MNKSILTKPLLLSQNAYLIIGVLIVLAYYIPFFIFGENTYVHIHDTLDIDVAHTKMLVDQHAVFDYNKTLPLLDGIPRSEYFICFSPYDFKMVFYSIMPTFWAYLTNSLLVRLLAFLGMFLLLSRYVLKEENTRYYNFIAFVCAIIFALIPFYTTFGLSSAGIPLLTWAFLNLKDKQHLVLSYLSIAFFANYSCLALSGVFVCLVFGCYYLYHAIKSKDWQWYIFAGICVLGFVYLLTNIDLFINVFFNSDYVSHRTEWKISTSVDSVVKDLLFNTQYHSGLLSTKPIIAIICIAILCQLRVDKRLGYALLAIGAVLCIYFIRALTISYLPFMRAFQMDRFYFFLPFLWIIALSVSLENITNKVNVALALFLLLPVGLSLYNNNDELKSVVHQLKGKQPNRPTYKQFYDETLFTQITESLNVIPNNTRVVSVGLFPSIAEYNGYHTLDTYINIYPLEYKHKFREVIAPELDKDEGIKAYFDKWGSRCYMFSSEIDQANVSSYMINKYDTLSICPEYNINALRRLGAQYIFSAIHFDNVENLGLQEKGVFTTDESLWQIYVYGIE